VGRCGFEGESEFDFGGWRCGDVEVSGTVCERREFANAWCSYEHHSIEEPAILLGGAFVVQVAEKERESGKHEKGDKE
jgi:hypothetical protein